MSNNVNGKETFSREPMSSAQKWALQGATPSLFSLLHASLETRDVKKSPLYHIARLDYNWRVTGMELIGSKAGVTRKDVLANPTRAVNKLIEFVKNKNSRSQVVESVVQLLADRDTGKAGVSPLDTRTNGTTIIRDLVNPRKKEYRTYFTLPSLHWGSCQCCSTNSHLTFIKRLGTLKGLDEGQTKSVLQDVFSSHDKLVYPTLLAEVFAMKSDDVLGSILHIVDGPGNLVLMQYCISPRRTADGEQSWSIQPYCIECMRNFEDPAAAVRYAHTFRMLAKLRHEMMVAGRHLKQVSAEYSVTLRRTQQELEAASAHLELTRRAETHSQQGRTTQQRSSNFSKHDEDALAREAFAAGLHNEVIKGRKKSDLWRIKVPNKKSNSKRAPTDSIKRLRNLIDVQLAIADHAESEVDIGSVWDKVTKEEE